MPYDARADSSRSYDVAIDAMRERHEAIMAAGAKRIEYIGDAVLIQGDCLEVMPALGRVDAVITDPPYGIGEAAGANKSRSKLAKAVDYGCSDWDNQTADEAIHFARSICNQSIIFGGNYYSLPPTSCWLVWDKLNTGDFADCELAWTNLPKAVRRIKYLWSGMIKAPGEVRGHHPTQKPIGVMKWCIQQLSKDTNTILDPFMGSGTTLVAATQLGRRSIGIELDPDYFDIACKRVREAWKQPRLFDEPKAKPAQTGSLFDGET